MNLKKKLICAIAISLLCTACQQTPSTTLINNEELEIATDATVEDIDKIPIINLNSGDVDEVVECGEISVTLKGKVIEPDSYNDIYINCTNGVLTENDQ